MAERKTLQDLTIKDNFMFGAVMMDEEICRELLEFVLGFRIAKVTVSIGVQGAIRSKPCNFRDLLCYPQSAYVHVRGVKVTQKEQKSAFYRPYCPLVHRC